MRRRRCSDRHAPSSAPSSTSPRGHVRRLRASARRRRRRDMGRDATGGSVPHMPRRAASAGGRRVDGRRERSARVRASPATARAARSRALWPARRHRGRTDRPAGTRTRVGERRRGGGRARREARPLDGRRRCRAAPRSADPRQREHRSPRDRARGRLRNRRQALHGPHSSRAARRPIHKSNRSSRHRRTRPIEAGRWPSPAGRRGNTRACRRRCGAHPRRALFRRRGVAFGSIELRGVRVLSPRATTRLCAADGALDADKIQSIAARLAAALAPA
jgi:hypothetical protein